MRRIPIKVARKVGKENNLSQVIIMGWDGKYTHVVTWGKTVIDCDQAAQGGNMIKKHLGFPKELCITEPNRVKNLKAKLNQHEEKLALALKALEDISTGRGICVSREYDPNPTEQELAKKTLEKIKNYET